MLEAGGYIAIALIAVWVVLIFSLVRGKTTKAVFVIVSLVIVFAASFFWMANRVTEMTIPSVGTIKTAATLATQYIEDIKNIKSDIEHQREQISAAIDEIKEARREAARIKNELELTSPRHLTDEQEAQIADNLRKYAGQKVQIATIWDDRECVSITKRIVEVLKSANWDVSTFPLNAFLFAAQGITMPGMPGMPGGRPPFPQIPIADGVSILVSSSPPTKTKDAANALIGELNQAKIRARDIPQGTWQSSGAFDIHIGKIPFS